MEYFGYFAILITILYFFRELKNKFTSSNTIESDINGSIIQNGKQIIINGKIDKQVFK